MPLSKQAERERGRRRRRDATIQRLRSEVAELTAIPGQQPVVEWPDDPAAALAEWSAATLVIPPGHPNAGQPLVLPPYGVAFIRDALDAFEALLCIGRKNAKSAIVGVYLLGRLVGPLRTPGYRAGVVSINREKATELWRQCEQIATASGLAGVQFRRAPYRIIGPDGDVDILSADRNAGHASGFDDSIFDELGLIPERGRDLVNGLRSAVSARNGRFIALSIQGDSPFTREMLERRGERGLAIHHYGAPDGCALDDPAAWAAANPGIALGIKSREYMAHAAARAISVPADAGAFRAFELNQPVSPSAQMIVALADYQRCVAAALPARDGDCWIALDCGGAASFTAAAAYWPVTGRCELYAGVGGIPDLQERSRADGVGDLYPQMAERGELWTYPQRETPIDRFLADVGARLDGAHVGGLVADEYRAARLRDGLDAAGLDEWAARLVIRPVRWKTGNDDCVGFQTAVITGQVTFPETLILPAAIRDSRLTADDNGNVRLDKSREHGRIDVLMAAILAVAAGQRNRELSGWDPGYHGTF